MVLLLTTLMLALQAAPPPAPPPEEPPPLDRPEWLLMPTADQVIRAFPDGALEQGVSGKTTLECRTTGAGLLDKCQIVAETPDKAGFGEASLRLARFYKMKAVTEDGAQVGGRLIRVSLTWHAPDRFALDGLPYDIAPRDKVRWEGLARPTRPIGDAATIRLICRIRPDGRLSACAEPGAARAYDGTAKWIARKFKAAALDADGKPVAGRLVVLEFPDPKAPPR